MKKRMLCGLLLLAMLMTMLAGCKDNAYDPLENVPTTEFVDDAGRTVTVPAEITRIAPSGSTAQMILMTVVPERLVGLSSSPSTAQMPYFPKELWYLPTFGQFYGNKANLNMESLISAQPQVIIDLGDAKDSIAQDMDLIQEQCGIPTVFINASLENLSEAYRKLGELLSCPEVTEPRGEFVEKTLKMAEENREKIPQEERKSVMFGTGATGLACNAQGSVQADVIPTVGAVNAIQTDEISNRGGGTTVDLEQVYVYDPDVIIFSAGGPYDTLKTGEWSELTAVKTGEYYEIPNLPYDWMAMPPSVNRILGIWWLGKLLYPEVYDYDMVSVAQEFYDLFWHYDLTQEEAEVMLSRSTGK